MAQQHERRTALRRLFTLLLALALSLASPVSGADDVSRDWNWLIGNWTLEIETPDAGNVSGRLAVWPSASMVRAHIALGRGEQGASIAYLPRNWTFDGDILAGSLWIWRHQGQPFRVAVTADPRQLEGTLWHPELGSWVPMRLLRRVPVAESVTVLRKYYDGGYRTDEESWAYETLTRFWNPGWMPGNLRQIRVVLRGRDLPLDTSDVRAVSVDNPSLYPDTRASSDGNALFVDIGLGPGTTPGPHRLFLNGEPMLFDLQISGAPVTVPPVEPDDAATTDNTLADSPATTDPDTICLRTHGSLLGAPFAATYVFSAPSDPVAGVRLTYMFRARFQPGAPSSVALEPVGPARISRSEVLGDEDLAQIAAAVAEQSAMLRNWAPELDATQTESVIAGSTLDLPLPTLTAGVSIEGEPPDLTLPAACASLFRSSADLAALEGERSVLRARIKRDQEALREEREKAGLLGNIWDSEQADRLERRIANNSQILANVDAKIGELGASILRRERSLNLEEHLKEIEAIKADPKKLAAESARRREAAIEAAREANLYKWKKIEGEKSYLKELAGYDAMIQRADERGMTALAEKLREDRGRLELARDDWRQSVDTIHDRKFNEYRRLIDENRSDGIGPQGNLATILAAEGKNPAEVLEGGLRARAANAGRQAELDARSLGGEATRQYGLEEFAADLGEDHARMNADPALFLRRYGSYLKGAGEGALDVAKDMVVLAVEIGDTVGETFEVYRSDLSGEKYESMGRENLNTINAVRDYLSDADMQSIADDAKRLANYANRKIEQMASQGEHGVETALQGVGYTTASILVQEELLIAQAIRGASKVRQIVRVAGDATNVTTTKAARVGHALPDGSTVASAPTGSASNATTSRPPDPAASIGDAGPSGTSGPDIDPDSTDFRIAKTQIEGTDTGRVESGAEFDPDGTTHAAFDPAATTQVAARPASTSRPPDPAASIGDAEPSGTSGPDIDPDSTEFRIAKTQIEGTDAAGPANLEATRPHVHDPSAVPVAAAPGTETLPPPGFRDAPTQIEGTGAPGRANLEATRPHVHDPSAVPLAAAPGTETLPPPGFRDAPTQIEGTGAPGRTNPELTRSHVHDPSAVPLAAAPGEKTLTPPGFDDAPNGPDVGRLPDGPNDPNVMYTSIHELEIDHGASALERAGADSRLARSRVRELVDAGMDGRTAAAALGPQIGVDAQRLMDELNMNGVEMAAAIDRGLIQTGVGSPAVRAERIRGYLPAEDVPMRVNPSEPGVGRLPDGPDDPNVIYTTTHELEIDHGASALERAGVGSADARSQVRALVDAGMDGRTAAAALGPKNKIDPQRLMDELNMNGNEIAAAIDRGLIHAGVDSPTVRAEHIRSYLPVEVVPPHIYALAEGRTRVQFWINEPGDTPHPYRSGDDFIVGDRRQLEEYSILLQLEELGIPRSSARARVAQRYRTMGGGKDEVVAATAFEENVAVEALTERTGMTPTAVAEHLDAHLFREGVSSADARYERVLAYMGADIPPAYQGNALLLRWEGPAVRPNSFDFARGWLKRTGPEVQGRINAALQVAEELRAKGVLEGMPLGEVAMQISIHAEAPRVEVGGIRTAATPVEIVAEAVLFVRPDMALSHEVLAEAASISPVNAEAALKVARARIDQIRNVQLPPHSSGGPAPKTTQPPGYEDQPLVDVWMALRPNARQPSRSVERIEGTQQGVSMPAVEGGAWSAPDGTLQLGSRLGGGLFAEVHPIQTGPYEGDIAKIIRGDGAQVAKSADSGELASETFSTPNEIIEDYVRGAELLAESSIPHKRVRRAVYDEQHPYLVQERVREPAPGREFVGMEVILSEAQRPTAGQSQAVVTLHERMASSNLVASDLNKGNVYFRWEGGDRWTAGILDTDNIVEFGQTTSRRMHLRFLTTSGLAGVRASSPQEYMRIMLEQKWVKSGLIDAGALDQLPVPARPISSSRPRPITMRLAA